MPRCAVVVVNWNGARFLPACVAALAAQTYRDFALWVVDNGSTDGSLSLLAATAAGQGPPGDSLPSPLQLIRNPVNVGFAPANNQAFAAALADPAVRYVVPLNNDTVADPAWLETLVAPAAADPRLGSVASTLLFAAAPTRVASAGITLHRDGLVLDRGVGWHASGLPTTPQPVFGASAGAALYTRALLADVGLFDPTFHSYLEDADLAWRARLRGWRAVWAPQARVLHVVSATGGQGSPFKSYHLARNRLWCIAKNLPAALLPACAPYILRYDLLAILYGLARPDWALIRGRAAALRDLPRVLAQRRAIQAGGRVDPATFARWLAPAPGPWAAFQARRAMDAWRAPRGTLREQRGGIVFPEPPPARKTSGSAFPE